MKIGKEAGQVGDAETRNQRQGNEQEHRPGEGAVPGFVLRIMMKPMEVRTVEGPDIVSQPTQQAGKWVLRLY